LAALGPAARQIGHRLEHVGEIGSTNATLLERARAGEHGPLWLLADVQVAGRGRNARHWVSPNGNLYASLLLSDPGPPAHIAELSFVLSLALRDAVLAAGGLHDAPGFRLKWPNDLLVDGEKTAGLLLEGGQAGGVSFVVAGFGVNIVSHPEGTTHKATHLALTGLAMDRDRLLSTLSDAVVRRLAEWQRGINFANIRADWLAKAYGLGEPMRVATLSESFDGVFEGIDPIGRLIAATATGRKIISAGDVFPLAGVTGEHAA
jgi:BirA family transcriptional regulator, biotin operon repressor / biotin---[acetyl-CoA-carboxylase] ligase